MKDSQAMQGQQLNDALKVLLRQKEGRSFRQILLGS